MPDKPKFKVGDLVILKATLQHVVEVDVGDDSPNRALYKLSNGRWVGGAFIEEATNGR